MIDTSRYEVREKRLTGNGAAQPMVGYDPRRIYLGVFTLAGGSIVLSPTKIPTATDGIQVTATLPYECWWGKHGSMVCSGFSFFAANLTTITVIEVVETPLGSES